jgi:hypothetical protein
MRKLTNVSEKPDAFLFRIEDGSRETLFSTRLHKFTMKAAIRKFQAMG